MKSESKKMHAHGCSCCSQKETCFGMHKLSMKQESKKAEKKSESAAKKSK